jgi:hypothetical protein
MIALLSSYLRYQRVSTHRILHLLPRMRGDHPDYIIKGQFQTPYNPQHPNAIHENFKIPARLRTSMQNGTQKFIAPVINVDDFVELANLHPLDTWYLAVAELPWEIVGVEA